MQRLLPPLIFLTVTAIGLGLTWSVFTTSQRVTEARFQAVAEDAVGRVRSLVEQRISLLAATHALFEATGGELTRSAFQNFVEGLDLEARYKGMPGIGYAELIKNGEEAHAQSRVLADYDVDRSVWPQTEQAYRAPVVMLEPSTAENKETLGFDMASDASRLEAMQGAMRTKLPMATKPLLLKPAQQAAGSTGFIVYFPVLASGDTRTIPTDFSSTVTGFVFARFHAGDIHVAALDRLPLLPVEMQTFDATDGKNILLFTSDGFENGRNRRGPVTTVTTDVAGRSWLFVVRATRDFQEFLGLIPALVLGALSVLLGAALAVSTRSQLKAGLAARALNEITEKNLKERELLLQEMKHRIKNSIARVMAIARQTVSGSSSLAEFSTSFSSRLQAMANAQDMLTRSRWQRADLRELLTTELEQVFGKKLDNAMLTGDAVEINERATQAFGLVFHEMATNALKYGGVADDAGELSVSWRFSEAGADQRFLLDWRETGGPPISEPAKAGFGTRLIQANIEGELGGSVERIFGENGLETRISVPTRALL